MLPSVAVAVIVTDLPFPAFLAVTTPLEFTIAYFLLEVLQFRVLLAFFPVVSTVAFIVVFLPAFTVLVLHFNVTFLTADFTILTLVFAVIPLPSVAFAVMVTVLPAPAFLVVTTPLEFTVA